MEPATSIKDDAVKLDFLITIWDEASNPRYGGKFILTIEPYNSLTYVYLCNVYTREDNQCILYRSLPNRLVALEDYFNSLWFS
jgi:hypothetical protein